MSLIDHETQPHEQWRQGVMTLMRVSALVRSAQLCIFEQFCDPGLGAPIHLHAVEEVLEVMDGEAEVILRSENLTLRANQSIVIPAGARHGFRNIGRGILKVRATLASPIFEASYDDRAEQSRRWIPSDA